MENAAEALKIAGELLIGLLLISLFIFVFNRISSIEDSKSQQEAIQQTTDFNKKFNAFEKSSMYGTDLISVLGLAYANNKTANLEKRMFHKGEIDGYYDPDIGSSINIKFKLKEDICETKITDVYKVEDGISVQERHHEDPGKIIFKANTWYSLSEDNMDAVKSIKEIVIDGNTTQVETKKISNIRTQIITTDSKGFGEFKKNIFKCTSVDYNDVGRIYCMTFEPVDY